MEEVSTPMRTKKPRFMGRDVVIRMAVTLLGIMLFITGCGTPHVTTYTVSGRIVQNEFGLPGVTIAFSGMSTTAVTDISGNWTMSGLSGTVTVTPAKTNFGFSPASIEVSGARSDVNFTAQEYEPPAAPTNLNATGALRNIHLSWTASANATGYNVYRYTEGSASVKLNTVPITTTTYDNAIASPAGDGVWYYYKVTALNVAAESGLSGEVRAMHGTRPDPTYAFGFSTILEKSPYVVEGTVKLGGAIIVSDNTILYVLDNAVIDVLENFNFAIQGSVRVLASSGATHATFTAHSSGGGAPSNGSGFTLKFTGSDAGTRIQNTVVQYLNAENKGLVFEANAEAEIRNSYFSYNGSTGSGYAVFGPTAPKRVIIENCRFDGLTVYINSDLRPTDCLFQYNIVRPSTYGNSFYFSGLSNPGVDPGQFSLNDIDGSKYVYLRNMTGTSQVPLGNNFWGGGPGNPPTPLTTWDGSPTTITFDFANPSAPLSTSPLSVGPNWVH